MPRSRKALWPRNFFWKYGNKELSGDVGETSSVRGSKTFIGASSSKVGLDLVDFHRNKGQPAVKHAAASRRAGPRRSCATKFALRRPCWPPSESTERDPAGGLCAWGPPPDRPWVRASLHIQSGPFRRRHKQEGDGGELGSVCKARPRGNARSSERRVRRNRAPEQLIQRGGGWG